MNLLRFQYNNRIPINLKFLLLLHFESFISCQKFVITVMYSFAMCIFNAVKINFVWLIDSFDFPSALHVHDCTASELTSICACPSIE